MSRTLEPGKKQMFTKKGIEIEAKYLQMIIDTVGDEVAISADHLVGRNLENMTRHGYALGRRTHYLEGNHVIVSITGFRQYPNSHWGSMFNLESFQELIDNQAVEIAYPDMATSGGSLFVWSLLNNV